MSKKVRAFIAVELPKEVRERTKKLIRKLSTAVPDAKWVEQETLHLTLKFLGEITLNEVGEICQRLQNVAQQWEPFDFMLETLGAFPDWQRAKVLWVGATEGADQLVAFQEAVENEMAQLHFRKETKRFTPHLTLARLSGEQADDLQNIISPHLDFVGGVVDVEELVLFSSELRPTGPVYDPMAHIRLKKNS